MPDEKEKPTPPASSGGISNEADKPDKDAKSGGSSGGDVDAGVDGQSGDKAKDEPDAAKKADEPAVRGAKPGDEVGDVKGGKDVASEEKEKSSGKKKSSAGKLKSILQKAQMALHAAIMAMKTLSLLQLIAMLKMMMGMVVQLVSAAVAAIGQAVMGALTMIATAIGVSIAVATVGVVGVIFGVIVVAVVAIVGGSTNNNVATKDDLPPCNTDITYMEAPDDIPIQAWLNAKLIYSFYKSYSSASGLVYSDAQIAGILGNWYHESRIDPTSVETVFDEAYAVGPTKLFLFQGTVTTSYLTQVLPDGSVRYLGTRVSAGGADGLADVTVMDEDGTRFGKGSSTVHKPVAFDVNLFKDMYQTGYWESYPAIKTMGIGLGQWTNGRCTALMDFAADHGRDWYDLSLQLMFSITADTAGAGVFANWQEQYPETEDGAAQAAHYFARNWEGTPEGHESMSTREENARLWFGIVSDWKEGVDYTIQAGSSLWSMATGSADSSRDSSDSSSLRDCAGVKFADNSSLAAAIVSYAWGPGKDYKNNGTQCWQHLFSTMAPNDPYYKCCDRTVAIAVWWTGTDSNFPLGGTSIQLQYLMDNARVYKTLTERGGSMGTGMAYWEQIEIPWTGDVGAYVSKLQPGDILIRNDAVSVPPGYTNAAVGHVVMYVGQEAIQRRWPEADPKYCVVSGSINTNSPHIQAFTTGNAESAKLQSYYVFRNRMAYCADADRPRTALTCAAYSNES